LTYATRKNEKYTKRKLAQDANATAAQDAREQLNATHAHLKTFPSGLQDRTFERVHENERKQVLKKRSSLRATSNRTSSSRPGSLSFQNGLGASDAVPGLAANLPLTRDQLRTSSSSGQSRPSSLAASVSPLLTRSGSIDVRNSLSLPIVMLPTDAKPVCCCCCCCCVFV
jgi:hypothetical protein